MEIYILLIGIIILAETTLLLAKSRTKKLLNEPRRKIYVDTSVLMDGRILAIGQTGFISDDLIIPRSVIRELQLLADGKDAEKRAKARAGLDLVNELERVVHFDVEILQDELGRTLVDERLIELAKKNHGAILTLDFNLAKVAATEKIEVLNINDLVLALKNDIQPGTKMAIKITEKGSNKEQGVGHLDDGTMVVVEKAANKIGQTLEIEAVRFIQTSSGRMLFAKVVKANNNRRFRKNRKP